MSRTKGSKNLEKESDKNRIHANYPPPNELFMKQKENVSEIRQSQKDNILIISWNEVPNDSINLDNVSEFFISINESYAKINLQLIGGRFIELNCSLKSPVYQKIINYLS